MRFKRSLPAVVAGLSVILAACSNSSSGGPSGSAGQAARTIRVRVMDSLRFDPTTVTVKAGESVRFVVTNVGSTKHEFIVGDDQAQMEHEGQIGMGSSMPMEGMGFPALELAPGETKEATVTFDQTGTLMYGCHEPGHYKGGMVGTITVTG